MKSASSNYGYIVYKTKNITVGEFISFAGFRAQIRDGQTKVNSETVKQYKNEWNSVMYDNPDTPIVTLKDIQESAETTILAGHTRQQAARELVQEGLVDVSDLIPIRYPNKKLPLEKRQELVIRTNQGNMKANSINQIHGFHDCAKFLYKPIYAIFDDIAGPGMTGARKEQNTRLLASLFNYNPQLLKTPKKITAHTIYNSRSTAIGSKDNDTARYLLEVPQIDLRQHVVALTNIIAPGLKMLMALKEDPFYKACVGQSKHIEYLILALGARGVLASTTQTKTKGKITLGDFIKAFKNHRAAFTQLLLECNNKTKDSEIDFVMLLRKVKKGLELIHV